MRVSLSEADLSSLDTSLWFRELHLGRDQILLARVFSAGMLPGMLPEMSVSRFPVIVAGEEC